MKNFACLGIAALAFAVGCNTPQEGAEGNISFVPDECGRVGGCDFEDSIGVGGVIDVHIMGIEGFSTAGVTLESDDPSVLEVTAVGDVGGRATWEVYGAGAGVGRIVAYDSDDRQVDFIEVGVQELSGLTLENFVGDAIGPDSDPDYDEVWTVNANENVSFFVTPVIGDGVPTMGRYTYTESIDGALTDHILEPDRLSEGYLDFNAPAGTYEASFDDNFGNFIDVLIVAE